MKRNFRNVTMIGLIAGMLATVSCKQTTDEDKDASAPMQNEMHEGDIDDDAHVEDQMLEISEDENKAQAEFSDDKTAAAYEDYLEVKEAMVAADVEAAKEAAKDLAEVYADGEQQKITNLAGHIATTDDIHRQRELFSELTAAMEPVLKNGIASGEIYKQFCPMAFEGKGDYWYSDTKTIRNPYFGEKMLNCGRTEETIQ